MSGEPTALEVMRALRPAVVRHLDDEPADGQGFSYPAVGFGDLDEPGRVDGRLEGDTRAGLSALLEIKGIRQSVVYGHGPADDPWRRWLDRWAEREHAHRETLRRMLGGIRPAVRQPSAPIPARAEGALSLLAELAFEGQLAYELTAALIERVPASEVAALRMMCADDRRHAWFFRDMCAEAFDLAPDGAARAVAEALPRYLDRWVTPTRRLDVGLLRTPGVRDELWHHRRIVLPVLRQWNMLERNDLGPVGQRAQTTVSRFVERLDEKVRAECAAGESRRDREALRHEREAAFLARMGIVPEMAF